MWEELEGKEGSSRIGVTNHTRGHATESSSKGLDYHLGASGDGGCAHIELMKEKLFFLSCTHIPATLALVTFMTVFFKILLSDYP